MAEGQILDIAQIRDQLSELEDQLSKADYDRLVSILPFFTPKQGFKAVLATCLDAVSKRPNRADKLNDFRAFRNRLRQASHNAGVEWRLEVDAIRRADPAERFCWFALLENTRDQALTQFAQNVVASLDTDTAIEAHARVSIGPRPVRMFVSYDTEMDQREAQDLLQRLRIEFRASKNYECEPWDESRILVGEHRAEAYQQALRKSDVGLLLLSSAWLAKLEPDGDLSDLVLNNTKPIIPVALREVNEKQHQLYGLENHVIFRLASSRGKPKSFSACLTREQKDQFAQALGLQIEQRLDRWIATIETAVQQLASSWADDENVMPHAIEALARETSLRSVIDLKTDIEAGERQVVAIEALEQWALDPESVPYCALLGEYGVGKTTTLKMFTERLLRKRRGGEAVPLPMFIDLRHYSPTIHQGEVPNLETLLQEILDRVWETTRQPALKAQDVLNMVRDEGAILIFDGLDEKLVHLDETQGRAFLRTLWQALPVAESRSLHATASYRMGKAASRNRQIRGRLIFSCRSHYFKTLRDQNSMLRGDDRDGVYASDYRAWVLLPFDEKQIRMYLKRLLGEHRVDVTVELFESIHNLRELAERPYLLSLMSKQITTLEHRQARGETVHGVTLYELLAEEWLARDGGKHHLRPEDKLRLMEDMAADMWRDGAREWEWRQVLYWLGARLASDDVLRTRYDKIAHEILEEDFRTATFVLRPDRSERDFRFAHTSLQEYFLARYLLRGLINQQPELWIIPLPSPETLDFLGQLIETLPGKRRSAALQTLSGILGDYQPQATGIAFRYWLLAIEKKLPEPEPLRVDLHGADLSGLTVRGHSHARPLNLVDADLSGARLVETRFQDINFSYASLAQVQATRAEFHRVTARQLLVRGADMTAAIWRHCKADTLKGADSVHWYGCQWVGCELDLACLPSDFALHGAFCTEDTRLPSLNNPKVTTIVGHRGPVNACGFSLDGTQIVSGSSDRDLKVWDARSGQCIQTLSGHEGSVRASRFSPDGKQIVSGSSDGGLKVWDARSGHCIQTLKGHRGSVYDCRFSPDGTQIVSGSSDGGLKVWDARSGQCAQTLKGHDDWINACGFSPDGTQIVSGSSDQSLKVWDARSGQCAQTLSGHSGSVLACGFSPDGTQIVSGSSDQSLKVWDVRSGQCIQTLSGHRGSVNACGFSSAGMQIVSGSVDGMKVWDVRSGQCIQTLSGYRGRVRACGFSPDGMQIVSGSDDGGVKVWDARSGQCIQTLSGHRDWVRACGFSPDGTQIVSGSDDARLKVWDILSGQCIQTLSGHRDWVRACGFSPDGTQIVSGSSDRDLKVWDARSGQCIQTLSGHSGSVLACGFSPDSLQIVSGSDDGGVKVWDARSGQCIQTLSGHRDWVRTCGFSPDGTQIVSGSDDGGVKVWDARSGQCIQTLSGYRNRVFACRVSRDSTQVVTGYFNDGGLEVWDVRSGQCIQTLRGHRNKVLACGFSPDGTQIVSGSSNGDLKVWDVRNGQCIQTLKGHGGSVFTCDFSPDGTQILSGASDNSLRLWTTDTGEARLTLINGPDGQTAALDECNNRIVSVSPEAWRFLGWRVFDPEANRLRILPAEHFGPLPVG